MKKKIIAVDFDGCLVTNIFPEIGDAIYETINALKIEKARGARVILWTCRRGERLTAAVKWCEAQGIQLDAVNENLPEIVESFGGDTRKIFANEYWDDRARLMPSDGRQIFLPFATSGKMTVSAGFTTVNAHNGDATAQISGKICVIECTQEESDRHDKVADEVTRR